MTNLKKLASLLLAFALLLTMVGTAMAAAPTATVTIENMSGVVGGTYKMWKLLDATKSADGKNIAYTVSDTYRTQLMTALGYTEDANKSKEENNTAIIAALDALKLNAAGLRTFANTLFNLLKTGNADFDTGETTAVKTEIQNVPYGYYLIGQTNLSTGAQQAGGNYAMASLNTITADLTIQTKQDTPTHVKKIRDTNDSQNSTPVWSDSADYDIGDAVPFQIYGRVSKNLDQYTKYQFIFHDEMCDGLDFNESSVKVYASKGGGSEYAVTEGYTLTTDADKHGFTLAFSDLKTTNLPHGMKDGTDTVVTSWADVKIVVLFDATLNTSANIGATGNENVSYLEYSNDFNNENSTGKTPPDKVIAFTFQLVVNKVDKDGNALTGAEFTLWKRFDRGVVDDEPTRVDRTEQHKYEFVKIATISGETSSTFTFQGLDDGYYKLEETKVPDGYNKADDILFRIIAEHSEGDNPTLTSLKVVDNDGQPISGDPFQIDVTSGKVTTSVKNLSGAELPETGGIGTTIFYVLGSLLVAAAVVLLVTKRRMAAREN